MSKPKTKIMSLFMALIFIASLMAGRTGSSTNGEKEPSPTNEGTSPSQNAEGDYPDYSQGFPERVTLEIPVYERAFEGWNVTDNYYTRWIQKEFGDKYNIEVKFTPIARTNEVTTYQQMPRRQGAGYHFPLRHAASACILWRRCYAGAGLARD